MLLFLSFDQCEITEFAYTNLTTFRLTLPASITLFENTLTCKVLKLMEELV